MGVGEPQAKRKADAALAKYEAQRDDLYAGRIAPPHASGAQAVLKLLLRSDSNFALLSVLVMGMRRHERVYFTPSFPSAVNFFATARRT